MLSYILGKNVFLKRRNNSLCQVLKKISWEETFSTMLLTCFFLLERRREKTHQNEGTCLHFYIYKQWDITLYLYDNGSDAVEMVSWLEQKRNKYMDQYWSK